MDKIHNGGLVNSKTPGQTGSFQGQQVTVTLSLSAEGVNVRERQLPRRTDQCLIAFQGVQAWAPYLYSCSQPFSSEVSDTHRAGQHIYTPFCTEVRRRQTRALALCSHSGPPSIHRGIVTSAVDGGSEQPDLGKGYFRLNNPKTGH